MSMKKCDVHNCAEDIRVWCYNTYGDNGLCKFHSQDLPTYSEKEEILAEKMAEKRRKFGHQ